MQWLEFEPHTAILSSMSIATMPHPKMELKTAKSLQNGNRRGFRLSTEMLVEKKSTWETGKSYFFRQIFCKFVNKINKTSIWKTVKKKKNPVQIYF